MSILFINFECVNQMYSLYYLFILKCKTISMFACQQMNQFTSFITSWYELSMFNVVYSFDFTGLT